MAGEGNVGEGGLLARPSALLDDDFAEQITLAF